MSCDSTIAAGDLGLLAIDYVDFHVCTMGGSVLSWLLLLLILAFLFWLLGDTADTYFSPILGQICETVSSCNVFTRCAQCTTLLTPPCSLPHS